MKRKYLFAAMCLYSLNAFAVEAIKSQPTDDNLTHLNGAAANPSSPYCWPDHLTGTFTVASNYIFRGITQTENLPAFQGGLNYDLPYHFYLSLWGSNAKFPDTDATVEVDPSIGFNYDLFDNFNLDLNLVRYQYPSAHELNYNEFVAVAQYYFLQATIGYSGNVYNVHESGTYLNGGINYDIPACYAFNVDGLNFKALIGHYNLPEEAGADYTDYLIGISKKVKHYEFGVQWTDTNHAQNNAPYDTSKIVAMITANF